MANIPSFYSNRRFYGDERYPYGLDRSGEFTREQAALLIQHGCAYQALANGERPPVTDEEVAFIEFCQGGREPQSNHEKAWKTYCDKVAAPKPTFSYSLDTGKQNSDEFNEPVTEDEFE